MDRKTISLVVIDIFNSFKIKSNPKPNIENECRMYCRKKSKLNCYSFHVRCGCQVQQCKEKRVSLEETLYT